MARKPSRYCHGVTESDNEQKNKSEQAKEKIKDSLAAEPMWEEFIKSYKKNLGRHSVNYHSWYAVQDSGLFKDIWDCIESMGGIGSKTLIEKYPAETKFTIPARNLITHEEVTIECESDKGNIEDIFEGFLLGQHFMPFISIRSGSGWIDGFAIPGCNNCFPMRGSLTLRLVDNTHWPALGRGSIILINQKFIPENIDELIKNVEVGEEIDG